MTLHPEQAALCPQTATRIGSISLVGAGPGTRDLLTFRAASRLQQADVVFYDRLVDPAILDIARPGAQRIFVGKHVGANAWPQTRINRAIVAAALQGQRVVRLKSGDPSIFGRASEEIAAARAAGIVVEIVPGITAASAAAASLCQPLTERGQTDRIVFVTGTCRPGDPPPDIAACLQPGTAVAIYMGVHRLAEIQAELLTAGLDPQSDIAMVSHTGTSAEQRLTAPLCQLASAAKAANMQNPAIIFVRNPKAARSNASTLSALNTVLL